MKTVRMKKEVVRVSDSEAEKLVKAGKGKYVPKSTWKKNVRDKKA